MIETITKEEMLEFAHAVREEESFNAWMEKGENRSNIRFHVMKLTEEVGNVGMQMGLRKAVLEFAKMASLGGETDVTDADDEIPTNRTLN